MKPNQIFISFSSKESDEAHRVCTFLEENGFPCFISLRDLIAGEEYAAQLVENIQQSSAVVLLLSRASNASPHVLREVECAVSKHIPILVYTLEEVTLSKSMEYYLMTHQWIPKSQDSDLRLVGGLKHLLAGSPAAATSGMAPANAPSSGPMASTNTAPANAPGSGPKKSPAQAVIIPILIGVIAFLLFMGIFLFFKPSNLQPVTPDTQGTSGNPNSQASAQQALTVQDATQQGSGSTVQGTAYKLGDTITFGTYYDQPIEWRVLKINEDNTLVLLSKYLLTMKTFSAPQGGTYNEYNGVTYWSYEQRDIEDDALLALVRGNNDWSVSPIRTWLNSAAEVVTYRGQAPTRTAVGNNHYSSEAGFLHSFTQEERDALVPVTHLSPANSLSEGAENGVMVTQDLVYLLSSSELSLLTAADISIYAQPTQACIDHDMDHDGYAAFSATFHTTNYYWWLRDNPGEKINQAYAVVTEIEDGYTFYPSSVGICSYGIRPVICVDLSQK